MTFGRGLMAKWFRFALLVSPLARAFSHSLSSVESSSISFFANGSKYGFMEEQSGKVITLGTKRWKAHFGRFCHGWRIQLRGRCVRRFCLLRSILGIARLSVFYF